jgi:hypothetical protein
MFLAIQERDLISLGTPTIVSYMMLGFAPPERRKKAIPVERRCCSVSSPQHPLDDALLFQLFDLEAQSHRPLPCAQLTLHRGEELLAADDVCGQLFVCCGAQSALLSSACATPSNIALNADGG